MDWTDLILRNIGPGLAASGDAGRTPWDDVGAARGIGILRLRLIFALTARKDQSSLRMTGLRMTVRGKYHAFIKTTRG